MYISYISNGISLYSLLSDGWFLFSYVAKNIILAGVKSVTLHDENVVELWDLSSNFVFTEEDVGKNRALASVQKLQELNNAVAVSTLTEKLTKEQLSGFQVFQTTCLFGLSYFFSRSSCHLVDMDTIIRTKDEK